MDFTIETKELQSVIKSLGIVVKPNMTTFEGRVVVEIIDDNKVLFTSSNGSTSISVSSIPTKIKSTGKFVTSFDKMKSFINSFISWDGVCGVKDFHFIVDEKKKSARIKVTNVYSDNRKARGHIDLKYFEEFAGPELETFGEAGFIFNSEIFKKAVDGILYSVDPNERREFIQGINLIFDNKGMFFVGSNGRMLSEYKIENPSKIKDKNYLIKYDFVSGIRRLIKDETQIFFNINDVNRSIKSNFDNIHFYGKIIIGHEYPPYKETLESFKENLVLDKMELMESLAPFMDLLNQEDNNRLTFSIKDNSIVISSDDASFTCDLDVKYKGEFVIDINGRYLFQTLDAIKDEIVKIKFSDDKGCLMFDSGSSDIHKTLITPIKRKGNV